jgi:hypothetical protein
VRGGRTRVAAPAAVVFCLQLFVTPMRRSFVLLTHATALHAVGTREATSDTER